jgi:mutator protein MutT
VLDVTRAFPDRPVIGVGAVIFDAGRVLLVRRGHAPLEGEWSLPGGAVETGETLEAALIREVREETGLDVAVSRLVEVVDRIHRLPDGRVEYHYVVVDYVCVPGGTQPIPGSDAADVRWVALPELDDYGLSPTARAVINKALAVRPDDP